MALNLTSNAFNGAAISFGANLVRGGIFESEYPTGAVLSAVAALVFESIALIVASVGACKEEAVKVHAGASDAHR